MSWQLVLTTSQGLITSLLGEYESFRLRPTINGAAQLDVTFDPGTLDATQLLVAERAVKAYQDGVLRFYGKVWEPLELASNQATLTAKDPYAEMAQRRIRLDTTYTGTDAGTIAQARVTAQNALTNTFLRNGGVQASVNRDRNYGTGTLESDVFDDLAGAAQGFFFKVTPVDNLPSVMGDLVISYPNAGATREEIRFEYGEGTQDTLSDYHLSYSLPRNRQTVASSSSTGGRISQVAEDTASQARYGLFEDETTYSDVSDTTLLQQQAASEIRASPPLVAACVPADNSPLLNRDFVVGDFVRLGIRNGNLRIFTWVRVTEAELTVDRDGIETMSALSLELVTGGKPNDPNPEALFRSQLDENRRRLEALERKVENIDISGEITPPPAPTGGGGDYDPTPGEPAPPPPEPPVTVQAPPDVTMDQSDITVWSRTRVVFHAHVTANGSTTAVWFDYWRVTGAVYGTSSAYYLPGDTTDAYISVDVTGLSPDSQYRVRARATNSSGTTVTHADASVGLSFRTLRVDPV